MKKNVFTISPLYSFADTLAETLLAENKGNPLNLAQTLVLLPTRRACLTLNKAFLQKTNGKPFLLPRILSFAALEADETALSFLTAPLDNLPKAISPAERILLLTRLILQRPAAVPLSADKAFSLAKDLANLLDEMTLYGVTQEKLEQIVPDDFAHHWQDVLSFLKIITENWPLILKERGLVDSAQRRCLLFNALAQSWKDNPPPFPVVAAGSTGSVPTTKILLDAIAGLPQGKVILPGVNKQMSRKELNAVKETHPQYHLVKLLEFMNVSLDDVAELTGTDKTASFERFRLVNEALRPFDTTEVWHEAASFSPEAIDGVTRLDCPDESKEALCIALILRKVIEDEGKTAALITPDRNLSKRVIAYMKRFGVITDDSAGEPLSSTSLGAFLSLTLRASCDNLQAYDLLALLKHPLSALNLKLGELRRLTRKLEKNCLRGVLTGGGLAYLKEKTLSNDTLHGLATGLQKALGDFIFLLNSGENHHFGTFLKAHLTAAELLAQSDDKSGAERLWTGGAGESATELFDELFTYSDVLGDISAEQYASLFNAYLHATNVRLKYGMHPRIDILGTMEARLVRPDVLILGSLNEGKWPKDAQTDAWFSRPMRQACALPLPEHLTGLAAHDFAQSFCAPTLFLTRAVKENGTPSVPSRWLLRLETVLKMSNLSFETGDWLKYATLPDAPEQQVVFPPPAPKPPLSARPRSLSVTKIETLMRDPYSIYARYVLGLKVEKEIDEPVSPADFGTMLHDVLRRFVEKFGNNPTEESKDFLFQTAFDDLKKLPFDAVDALFYEQRLKRALEWFFNHYKEYARTLKNAYCEQKATISFQAKGGPFTLTGIADRIDEKNDGTFGIIDYKTGNVPKSNTVKTGYAPQLPLEAAMLEQGAFENAGKQKAAVLEYWLINGKKDGNNAQSVSNEDGELSDFLFHNLVTLINAFDDENKAYDASPDLSLKPRYNEYDCLARYKEWSVSQGSEDDDESA